MIEISEKRNPISSLKFVIILNCFLLFTVVVSNFSFIAWISAIFIGSGFTLAMIHIKDIYRSEDKLVIKNAFGAEEFVSLNNIVKLVKGKHMARSYTLHYIKDNGAHKQASFFPKISGFLHLKKNPEFMKLYDEYFFESNT